MGGWAGREAREGGSGRGAERVGGRWEVGGEVGGWVAHLGATPTTTRKVPNTS